METQSTVNEHSPLLIAGRITQNKVFAILITLFNFLISFVGTVILFRKASGLYDGRIDGSLNASYAAIVLLLLPVLSILHARSLTKEVTTDPKSREAIMWAILLRFSTLLFFANMLLIWIYRAFRG